MKFKKLETNAAFVFNMFCVCSGYMYLNNGRKYAQCRCGTVDLIHVIHQGHL